MYAQIEKSKENKSRTVTHSVAQKKSDVKQGFGLVDNRPEAMSQRKLQSLANHSPRAKQTVQLPSFCHNHSVRSQEKIQKHENNTGLTNNLQAIATDSPIQRLTLSSYAGGALPGGTVVTAIQHQRVAMTAMQQAAAAGHSRYALNNLPSNCHHHAPYSMVKNQVINTLTGGTLTNGRVWLNARGGAVVATGAGAIDPADYDGAVDDVIADNANHPDNLFYWPDHDGDGGGTKYDYPKGNGARSVGGFITDLNNYSNGLQANGLVP